MPEGYTEFPSGDPRESRMAVELREPFEPPDIRMVFRKRYREICPDEKDGAIPVQTGLKTNLFQIQNYAEEFIAAYESRESSFDTEDDESVSLVADEIEQTCGLGPYLCGAGIALQRSQVIAVEVDRRVAEWRMRVRNRMPSVCRSLPRREYSVLDLRGDSFMARHKAEVPPALIPA